MNTARIGREWVLSFVLSIAATSAAGQEYQFQIDQPTSGGNAQLQVKATTDGTLIGNYDATTNPTGTRTKPGLTTPGATENLPVSVNSFNPDAGGSVVFSPSGSFRLSFDIAAGAVTCTNFTTSLLGGNSASIPVNATVSIAQFKTVNPVNSYPSFLFPMTVSLGNAVVSLLSATQIPGNAAGTLTPVGGGVYSFNVAPMVILQANVDFQGSPMVMPSDPMPFPLAGTVTLSGDTATLIESAPVNLSSTSAPNQPMAPMPYDLPSVPFFGSGQPAHVIFNLTLRTTQTAVQGTQSLKASGLAILPTWTGASTQSSGWSDPANWSATVPNAVNAVAKFSSSIAPHNVTLDAPVTVGTIELSDGQSYGISGTGPMIFSSSGAAKLSVLAGPSTGHTIAAPLVAQSNLDIDIAAATALNLPQGLTVAPGIAVEKSASTGALHLGPVLMQSDASRLSLLAGPASIARLTGGQLEVGDGATVSLDSGSAPSMLDGLVVQGSGTLDLAGDDVILRYTGGSPHAAYSQLIRQRAIFSSEVPTIGTAAVALVHNALLHLTTWNGLGISDGVNFSQLLFISTCAGDNNLDGIVDPSDYANVIANMGRMNAAWFDGDMDGDSVVSPADLGIVSRNQGASVALIASAAAQLAPAGLTTVPEPAGLGLFGAGVLLLLFRHRHLKNQQSVIP